LWGCQGFDGINELQSHAGNGAHRNESRITTAANGDSKRDAKVLAFPARSAAPALMAA
jgi:hypothetical protein